MKQCLLSKAGQQTCPVTRLHRSLVDNNTPLYCGPTTHRTYITWLCYPFRQGQLHSFHSHSHLHFPTMPSAEPVRSASYVPSRFASGTFPVSRNYNLRQMLYNYSDSNGRDDSTGDLSGQVIPSFPFSDVPVYADTVDIEGKSCMSAHLSSFCFTRA